MIPPQTLPVKAAARLNVVLSATGWAACIAIWFVSMVVTGIFAPHPEMPLMLEFAGGLVVLVVVRLTAK